MDVLTNEVIAAINDLIETARNGENGYRAASESVEDVEVKALLLGYSQQWRGFLSELTIEQRRFAGEPSAGSVNPDDAEHAFFNFRNILGDQRGDGVLAECERFEEAAVHNYQHATQHLLPSALEAMVLRQYQEVQHQYQRIKELRNK